MIFTNLPPKDEIEKVRLAARRDPDGFGFPRPAKPVYDILTDSGEKDFWAYKCWVSAVERAEKGSGLEAFFRGQDLRFPLPSGFRPAASASVACGGDLMAVDCITPESTPRLFDGIRDFYMDADLTSANLETTIFPGGPYGRTTRPGAPAGMNASPEMLRRYWADGRGIGYVSTANNHSLDYGDEGALSTLDELDALGLAHSGTSRSEAERDTPCIVRRNGVSIAMLSFTADLNGESTEKPYLVNETRFNDVPCELGGAARQIAAARAAGADLVIVHAHWGWEFELYPHVNVVEAAHRIAEAGADVIIGTHPHVAQPMEKYVSGSGKRCLIVYSLGDFVSYHPLTKDSLLTYAVRFDAVKGTCGGTPAACIANLRMLPVYILASSDGTGRPEFRLVRFSDVLRDAQEPAGRRRFPLSEEARADLPRLKQILDTVLTPADRDGLIAE